MTGNLGGTMENVETTKSTGTSEIRDVAEKSLFDSAGRLIPFPDSRVYSQVSRRYFVLSQPKIDFGEIYSRIKRHLGIHDLNPKEFEERSMGILEGLKQNAQTKELLHAVHVPFICGPEYQDMDMGSELDKIYLSAVKRSYEEKFPEYKFTNYFAGKLEGQLSVVPGCRYEKFTKARKKGYVVGWYFPNCLAEYAIPDQRSLISRLPENLILSGAIDAAAAFIGTPEIIFKKEDGHYPNLLCLSAIQPKTEKFFHHFEAYGWNLEFNCRSYMGAVSEYWAGGLTVIE